MSAGQPLRRGWRAWSKLTPTDGRRRHHGLKFDNRRRVLDTETFRASDTAITDRNHRALLAQLDPVTLLTIPPEPEPES